MHKTILIFTVLITPFLFAGCVREDDKPEEVINYVEVGDEIPDFTIIEYNGSSLSTDDFAGKRSIIVFFTTTCSDCRRELPILNDAYMESKAEFSDLLFVAIAREDKPDVTEKYMADNNLSIPVYHDLDRSVFNLFANSTVPRAYVVNKQGIIIWMGIEKLNITAGELVRIIRDME